jgi:hypothetical protein
VEGPVSKIVEESYELTEGYSFNYKHANAVDGIIKITYMVVKTVNTSKVPSIKFNITYKYLTGQTSTQKA